MYDEDTVAMTDLGDIPDFSDVPDDRPEPWANGWYLATIYASRTFTDKNGNDQTFESSDTPAISSGRNIRLQVVVTRASDDRVMGMTHLINYRPEDFDRIDEVRNGGGDTRLRMVLTRMRRLQQIAGVRQFQRTADGGINLRPLFDKSYYVKLGPRKDSDFKEIKDFDAVLGPRTTAL
jgi:hypothetical protein